MTKVTLVIRSGGCPPSAQDRAQFRAQKRAAANNVSLASTARKAYELANQGPALAVRDLAESWRQPIANYRNHIEQACTATAFDAMELAREMEQEARNYCLSACSIADALIHQHQDTLRIIRSNWLEGLEERRRESIESELIENGTEPRRARRIADAPTLEIAESRAESAYKKTQATGGRPLQHAVQSLYAEAVREGVPHRKRAGWIAEKTGYSARAVRIAYGQAIAKPPTT